MDMTERVRALLRENVERGQWSAPPAFPSGAAGRYGWDGGMGTAWANDPGRKLIGILMTQRGAFPDFSQVYRDFWAAAYGAAQTPPPATPSGR